METVGVGRFDAGTEYRFEKVLSSLSRRGRISMFPFVFWIHSQTQVEVGIGSLSLGWPTNSCKNVKPKLEACHSCGNLLVSYGTIVLVLLLDI